MAGELFVDAAKQRGVRLLPVDSEHSAVFQCLQGNHRAEVDKIILTASGGPFLRTPLSRLDKVSVAQALKHPNWKMGQKITIDSATMMNKGLEVIEARWEFDMQPDRIDVVIHPESLVHSMVRYQDGSIIAQLGIADMRIPIAYALAFPHRLEGSWPPLDLKRHGQLNFMPLEKRRFPALSLAYAALREGGTMVRQWQDLFYESRYSASVLGKMPDFVKLADAYGIKGLRAVKPNEVEAVLREGLKHKGPVLMDIHTDPYENCYPMIPAGGAQHQMMLEDPPELKVAKKGGTHKRKVDEGEGVLPA